MCSVNLNIAQMAGNGPARLLTNQCYVYMVDSKLIQRIGTENGGMPLQSYAWACAKELGGQKVLWFIVDDDKACLVSPVYIKTIGFLKFGWIPHGIPYRGDVQHIIGKFKRFMRYNSLVSLVSFSYRVSSTENLVDIFRPVPHSAIHRTFIIDLSDKDENDIFSQFNDTTRKHIRRADKIGFTCREMNREDLQIFWNEYEKLASRKKFKKTCDKEFLFNLHNLCQPEKFSGLEFLASKITLDGENRAYLIGLKYGEYFLEFLKADVMDEKRMNVETKRLNWELIRRCKMANVRYYDFGGVNLENNKGVYDYKKGFGGVLSESSPFKFLLCI